MESHLYDATKKETAQEATDAAGDQSHAGQSGGFLARKGDGELGIKTIWRGYRALQNYVDALEMAEIGL